MKDIVNERIHIHIYQISLILLFFANICLYSPTNIRNYILIAGIAITLTCGSALFRTGFVIRIRYDTKVVFWLLAVYTLFTIYGVFFLATSRWEYNWDSMIFNLAEGIAFIVIISEFQKQDNSLELLDVPLTVALVLILLYIFHEEGANLGTLGMRLGDNLSGNVNTVGTGLGIISVMYSYIFAEKKKLYQIPILIAVFGFMLLTGSKKTIVFLIVDLFLIANKSKNKIQAALIVVILGIVFIYVVFENQYLYSVIGYRIQDMMFQLFGVGPGQLSHSTEDRVGMIREGFRLFLNHPILGGGEKYFAAASSTYGHYGYSHCNYVEMLCNFGVVGTVLFYSQHIGNLYKIFRVRKYKDDLMQVCIAYMITTLMVDWMMVSYSSLSIFYFPIIWISISLKNLMRNLQTIQQRD